MSIISEKLLNQYIDPVVTIDQNNRILFANTAAVKLLGPLDDKKCYEFIYKRSVKCPHCVRNDLDAHDWSHTIRRCRFIEDKDKEDIERYVIVAPFLVDPTNKYHVEIYAPVPRTIKAARSIMNFAKDIEEITNPDDVFRELVDFLSSDKTVLKFRTRFYRFMDDTLVLKFRDSRTDPPAYVENIDDFIAKRQEEGPFGVSFASIDKTLTCIDKSQSQWIIMTPEKESVSAFKVHFKAHPADDNKKLWYADCRRVQHPIALYCYCYDEDDKVWSVFEPPIPHTWLDIPIRSKHKIYGKLSTTLGRNPFLFYREYIEELRLIENFVYRRLTAIEILEETKIMAAQNVIHEVSQPAFAGLGSMEALRRRDRENGTTPKDDPIDYYLKKNVECSLRMVAFLNDRGRIAEDVPSFSDTKTNFLSDVIAPVVNLTRFAIYEKHLRDSGDTMVPSELKDIQPQFLKRNKKVKSVFDGITYEIGYSGLCDEVNIYTEKYRMQQVIYNLLNNALKYKMFGNDYRVEIQYRDINALTTEEADLFGKYFVIDITDQGFGIETGEEEEIFGLFKQGKNARKVSKLPGTGRGLYVCRNILRGIGGEIFVQNLRSPTVFRLIIPRECEFSGWIDNMNSLRERTREIMKRIREKE